MRWFCCPLVALLILWPFPSLISVQIGCAWRKPNRKGPVLAHILAVVVTAPLVPGLSVLTRSCESLL